MKQAGTEKALAQHPWEEGWEEQTEERWARQAAAAKALLAKTARNAPVALFGRIGK